MTNTILGSNDSKIQVNKNNKIEEILNSFEININILKTKYSNIISGTIVDKKIYDHIILQLCDIFLVSDMSELISVINSRNSNFNGYFHIRYIIDKYSLTTDLNHAIKSVKNKYSLQVCNDLYKDIEDIYYKTNTKISFEYLLDKLFNNAIAANDIDLNTYPNISKKISLSELFLAIANIIQINKKINNATNNIYSTILALTDEIIHLI